MNRDPSRLGGRRRSDVGPLAGPSELSLIARARRPALIFMVVTMIAMAGSLVVTLGVISGARAVDSLGGLQHPRSAGQPTRNAEPEVPLLADSVSAAASVTPSAPASAPPSRSPSASTRVRVKRAVAPIPKIASRTGNDRRVTFVNRTSQKIWVAGWQQTAKPSLTRTGWVLAAGKSLSIVVPDKWNGRFWGRTGCTFNASGSGHCVSGDCAGRFQCQGYGAIPASLAEYNFSAWKGMDFYDVSLVDGSNLPMYINHTGGRTKDAISPTGCSKAGCTRAVPCPKALRVAGGCASPCAKLGGDQYCCQGKWAPRSECDPTKWPVDYAAIFKKAEPFAYSYVDDDATSTFTCTGRCDYRITFGLTPT